MIICYDKMGEPVVAGDIVLVANRGELTRAEVLSLSKITPAPANNRTPKNSPRMVISWIDNPAGVFWPNRSQGAIGTLKLNKYSVRIEPSGLPRVFRIIKITTNPKP